MCVPRNGDAYVTANQSSRRIKRPQTIVSGAHFMCTTHAQLLVSWAASGNDLWEGGREREKGERKGERKREGGRSVNILVHSCSDATSRELRRIPHVFELPGYAQDAWGGLFRVSECLYK